MNVDQRIKLLELAKSMAGGSVNNTIEIAAKFEEFASDKKSDQQKMADKPKPQRGRSRKTDGETSEQSPLLA